MEGVVLDLIRSQILWNSCHFLTMSCFQDLNNPVKVELVCLHVYSYNNGQLILLQMLSCFCPHNITLCGRQLDGDVICV